MKTKPVRVHFGASRWWATPTLVKRILAKLFRQLWPNEMFDQHQLYPNQAIWASTKWGRIWFSRLGRRESEGGQGRGGPGSGPVRVGFLRVGGLRSTARANPPRTVASPPVQHQLRTCLKVPPERREKQGNIRVKRRSHTSAVENHTWDGSSRASTNAN